MSKRFFLSVTLALLTLVPKAAQAQEMPPLPVDKEVRTGTLPNGLKYYIRHNEWPKDRVEFYIAQKVGSMQENDEQRGLAHFLEHMCFNGTRHFPGNTLVTYLETVGVKFGVNLNAYTSFDETVYNISDVPTASKGTLDSCLLILSDWADGLLLQEEEIDKERGVIREEWRMRSSAMQRILNRQLPVLYPNSKYAYRMPIGLMSIIDNFKPQVLRDYYEKWYRPDLQGVIVVGDINVDEMEEKIKSTFSRIKMPANPAVREYYPVENNASPIYIVDKDKEQTNNIVLIMRKVDAFPKEMKQTMGYYAYQTLAQLYTGMLNARLGELSRKPDCPFVQASVSVEDFLVSSTKSSFTLTILPKDGQSEAAVKAAYEELERVRQFGFTAGELSRVKSEQKTAFENIYNNRNKQYNPRYTQQYVRHFLDNEPMMSIEQEHEVLNMLLPMLPVEAVNSLTQAFITNNDSNFVVVGLYPEREGVVIPTPESLAAAISAARSAKLEAYVDNVKMDPLVPVTPKPVKIKKEEKAPFEYTCWTLSNGARVFWRKTDFTDGKVSLDAVSYGGMAKVKDADVANGKLLDVVMASTGTGNFTATELEKRMAGIDASVIASLGNTTEKLEGSSATKDLRSLFELLHLRFGTVKNDPDAYKHITTLLKTVLENANKRPEKAFSDTLIKALTKGNLRQKELSLDILDKADYEAIKRIYKERFASAGDFDFIITGDFDVDSLRLFTETYLATLPGTKKRETISDPLLSHPTGEYSNTFKRAMEAPKGNMAVIYSGTMPYTPENRVAMTALGEILTQRFINSIREKYGLAYSVGAVADVSKGYDERFRMRVQLPVKPEKADTALIIINEELRNIAQNGVTEEELNKVREFMLKEHDSDLRKNSYWEAAMSDYLYHGKDTTTPIPAAYKKLSSDDVRRVMNEILKQNNRVTVIMLPEDLTISADE